MKKFFFDMADALQRHECVAIATIVKAQGSVPRAVGAKMLIFPDGTSLHTVGGGVFESLVVKDALHAIVSGEPVIRTYSFNEKGEYAIGAVCGGVAEVMIEVVKNTGKLFVVGGGHVGQALIEAASGLDFSITLVEDREEFACLRKPNKDVKVIHTSPDYGSIPQPDKDTYICLVSKGYVSDEAALRHVIRSEAKYIGMIGSRKKINTVYQNMIRDGFDKKLLDRVHAPIGLDITSDSPEEIAISILAEIIQVKNRK